MIFQRRQARPCKQMIKFGADRAVACFIRQLDALLPPDRSTYDFPIDGHRRSVLRGRNGGVCCFILRALADHHQKQETQNDSPKAPHAAFKAIFRSRRFRRPRPHETPATKAADFGFPLHCFSTLRASLFRAGWQDTRPHGPFCNCIADKFPDRPQGTFGLFGRPRVLGKVPATMRTSRHAGLHQFPAARAIPVPHLGHVRH